ncbi:putative short-chain dehydrogenases protein [Neofusicoccum parvum UCRNP2]|uniref:Putative short-chain dehydrogenases protein n=1 Tax=Botryosphaeria parva (strain UCR-NP2) TaxID=1287680 RepID=R1GN72_BOTPV|nr:putative short-chain dehydrogenases protein [Neofusicoccum parvum UCRNP2]
MPSDPRVSAIDNFTPTIHHAPGTTLRAAITSPLPTPYTVCIIGASRGIGAGVALSYARAGATTLLLAARNTTQLADVAAQINAIAPSCAVHTVACDISSPTSVRGLAAHAATRLRAHLDAVVVNSGYSGHVELELTRGDAAADGQWAQAFAVNALGTYHAAHYLVPLLLGAPEGAGRAFVVVGSIASCIRTGAIANSKYCVSKMAQVRIVEHVAEQFGARGLLAVAVHPGAVETEMAMESAPEEFKKYLVDDPELCGHFLVWLTREPGRFQWMNGRLLSANWDPDELVEMKEEVVDGDLLKFEAKTSAEKVSE